MLKEQTELWSKAYLKKERAYPAEYVIRIFKGNYPKLNFIKEGYSGKSILDVGCGDGRNFCLFQSLGFDRIAGTEISQIIVDKTSSSLKEIGIKPDIRVGTNNNLGFGDEEFDFLLSWNVCYYMDDQMDFSSHVAEYSRVLKKGGILVFSIPCKDAFVYKDGIDYNNGFMEIRNDWFKSRNGSVQRVFRDEKEIEDTFGTHFKDFVFGRINDDCFGLSYKWFIGYCIKK